MITTTTKFRLYVFDTVALAAASTKLFEYGTIIMVKGDNTRFKLGVGSSLSFDTPAVATAKTWSQLPWIETGTAFADAVALNVTGTLTAAQLAKRYITSTSAAAVSATLPTATLLGTAIGATRGTELDFVIDNKFGANIVTVVVNTGIVVGAGALTGNTTLTVPAGQFAKFKIIFSSATAALLYRTL